MSDSVPSAWTNIVLTVIGVLAFFGGLLEWVRRRFKAARLYWSERVAKQERRLTDLAAGQIRDMDMVRDEVTAKISALENKFTLALERHEAKGVERERANSDRIGVVHRRLDELGTKMAQREDVAAIQAQCGQILMLLAQKEGGRR